MSILPIHLYGQPVLRKKAKPIRTVTPELRAVVESMFETMANAQGIGLAANQVGVLDRVIVIDISEMEEGERIPPFALLNPEVVSTEGSWVMEEGCLSIPEIRGDVERAENVVVRYADLEGVTHEIEATGLLGRVLLHEIDHLNGVLFLDYLPKEEQKLLRGRLNKIERGETATQYPVFGTVSSPSETR